MDEISDVRTVKDFRLTTFSGYQKTKVRDDLMKKMYDLQIETACYWTAELVASGHFQELWDALFTFFARFIHHGNPRLAIYLRERYGIYYELSSKGHSITGSTISALELRNSLSIRKLFTEVVCVLAFSVRKPSLVLIALPTSFTPSLNTGLEIAFENSDEYGQQSQHQVKTIQVEKKKQVPVWEMLSKTIPNGENGMSAFSSVSLAMPNEIVGRDEGLRRRTKSTRKIHIFNMEFLMDRVSAPNAKYYCLKRAKDPEEWFIALNELAYQLSPERRNMLEACFWLEWILEYDAHCRSVISAASSKNKKKSDVLEEEAEVGKVGMENNDLALFGNSQAMLKTKTVGKGEPRSELTNRLVESKYEGDIVWSVWELLIHELGKKNGNGGGGNGNAGNSIQPMVMKSSHILFCVDYKTTSCRKKRYMLYFAISLITENVNYSGNIVSDEHREIVQRVVSKTDDIYNQLKHSEQRPTTDYLMNGIKARSNAEQTVSALDAMQRADMFQLNTMYSGKR